MNALLEDPLNIELLKLLCSGSGTTININELSKQLQKHRNTIKKKINELFVHKILDKPLYPFQWFFSEYPLLVIEKGDFPRDPKTNDWIEKDPYIWVAFFVKEEEYNTLLIEHHKSLHTYQIWKESITDEEKITITESYPHPSEAIFLSTENIVKFDPSTSIQIVEENYRKGRHKQINGLPFDDFTFTLLKSLLAGKGIRTNESFLANQINVHRRTIQRRIEIFLENNIISPAVCRFPRVWIPPEYFFVLSLIEIKRNKTSILRALTNDRHVPFISKTAIGRFNMVLFSTFYKIEDHLMWQEEYDQRFVGSIGAIKNTYLSPAMTFSIAQEYVSLVFLQQKAERIRGEALVKLLKGS
ncbi:MAG: hypothetical protein ACXAEU_04495 [Candidatus Hodarchaeales archaeon]|jgi:predicted transcriptional regulator